MENLEKVQTLIRAGAKIYGSDYRLALEKKYDYLARELVEHGEGKALSDLLRIIKMGNSSLVEMLLNKYGIKQFSGSSRSRHHSFSAGYFTSDNFWSPLHYAAALGESTIVQILLRKGADKYQEYRMVTSKSNGNGEIYTAQQVASYNNHDYTAKLIEEY